MDKQQFDVLIKYIKKLDSKLDTLIDLARLNAPKQEITKEEKRILALCNLKYAVAEMMNQTNKTRSSIEFILSSLRGKGLIKSENRNGRTVYSRT